MSQLSPLLTMELEDWSPNLDTNQRNDILHALESGKVIYLPNLSFKLAPAELPFLSQTWLNGKRKNISLEGLSVKGAQQGSDQEFDLLRVMISRYSQHARGLINKLFPYYQSSLETARTSFRPGKAGVSSRSWKKDDTRLHVDAFPSRPTHGQRILRVFSNVNPNHQSRVWRLGQPFESAARYFAPQIPNHSKWLAKFEYVLGITKSIRSEYDHVMLYMHDKMKADLDYQKNSPQMSVELSAGSTWICYSDQVLHAAMSGQFLFEQTFYMPVDALQYPEFSPLRVLESIYSKKLTDPDLLPIR